MKLIDLVRLPRFTPHRTALLFAVAGTSLLGFGVGLIWRTLERDNAAFVQQSIGDTGSMLATQVRLEVDRLKRILLELGELRIVPRLALQEREFSMETDPDFLSVSLWRREEPGQPLSRVFTGVNPRFGGKLTPAALAELQEGDSLGGPRLEPAFGTQARLISASLAGWDQPLALLLVPIGAIAGRQGDSLLSALVSLEKLQKFFSSEGLVLSGLVDADGVALTHSNTQLIGHTEGEPGQPLAPLFEHLKKPGTGIESGIQALTSPQGKLFYGGFRRISNAGLAVISSVPAEEMGSSTDGVRHQLIAYLLLVFLALGVGRYRWLKDRRAASAASAPGPLSEPSFEDSAPRKVAVVTMHGSMRGFNQLLDSGGAQEAADALNDFLAFSASWVRSSGGHFECQLGASFGAAWEIAEGGSAQAVGRAVTCALALRSELERLNEARKVDGKKPMRYGVGLHVGQALRARLGVVPELRESVTGEAPACARALDHIALAMGRDFVVSQPLLKSAHGVFTGEALGESRLTADTGLTECYAVEGFREEQTSAEGPSEGRFEATASVSQMRAGLLVGALDVSKTSRWLVNNGSQIVGPFAAEELARMLFAQELDFDCECWHEETGKASRLASAGIFSGGSEDAGASCWVFDGKQIHGPVTDGFVRTAILHGAFGPEAYVCENSTVAGWRRLAGSSKSEFEFKIRMPETGSEDEAA